MEIADEKTLQHVEKGIPALVQSAGTQAYWRTLAAGHAVLESEDGVIYEVAPGGSRRVVKHIAPATPVPPGTRRELR